MHVWEFVCLDGYTFAQASSGMDLLLWASRWDWLRQTDDNGKFEFGGSSAFSHSHWGI